MDKSFLCWRIFNKKYRLDDDEIVDFEITDREKFILISSYKHYYYIDEDDFKDFLKFLKDPDLYRNSKKYNI